jgi:hypothetical protein
LFILLIYYQCGLSDFLVHETCLGLGVTIIGGHTEVSSAVTRPVACVTMFGAQKRRISATAAREGDVIVMTKSAGIEGTLPVVGFLVLAFRFILLDFTSIYVTILSIMLYFLIFMMLAIFRFTIRHTHSPL